MSEFFRIKKPYWRLPIIVALAFAPALGWAKSDPYEGKRAASSDAELVQRLQSHDIVLNSTQVNGYQWDARADYADPRTGDGIEGAAGNLVGDTIYVSHGCCDGNTGVNLSAYNTSSDSWTFGGAGLPDAAVSRSEMAGATVAGLHYAIGGRDGPSDALEVFDPVAGSWTTLAPMPGGGRGGMGAASMGGLIYVVGGRTGGSFGVSTILDTHEVYDPVADSWSTLAPIPIAVSDAYATVAYNGKVYVFGGATDSTTAVSNVQIYDVASNSWSAGAPMPTARGAAMAGVCSDGSIAVFGGYTSTTGNLDTTEIYLPSNDAWIEGPDMPIPASEFAQGMTYDDHGHIYAIGSGIFGATGMSVQRLNCADFSRVPTLGEYALWSLVFVMLLTGLVIMRRRKTA